MKKETNNKRKGPNKKTTNTLSSEQRLQKIACILSKGVLRRALQKDKQEQLTHREAPPATNQSGTP